MRKRIIISCILLLTTLFSFSNEATKSRYQISLLTCTPGHQIYNLFGHTAIQIIDSTHNINCIFHYGVFNMYKNNFIPNFVAGKTDYEIGYKDIRSFIPEYKRRNSIIYQQVLNLSNDQKEALIDSLFENYKPKNRVYRYNFVLDNCATRPFNIIRHFAGNKLNFKWEKSNTTYRKIIHEFVGANNWNQFGIDLLIGSCADTLISQEATLGFPAHLHKAMLQGYFNTDSTTVPLVQQDNILVPKSRLDTIIEPSFWTPQHTILIFLLLTLLWNCIGWYHPRVHWIFPFAIFLCMGLIGCVITFLAYFSSHPLVQNNYTLFFLNPVQLIYSLLILIPYIRKNWIKLPLIICIPALIGCILLPFNLQFHDLSTILMLISTVSLSLPILWIQKIRNKTK